MSSKKEHMLSYLKLMHYQNLLKSQHFQRLNDGAKWGDCSRVQYYLYPSYD